MRQVLREHEIKNSSIRANKLWRRKVGAGIAAAILCSPLTACDSNESINSQGNAESCSLRAGVYSHIPNENGEGSELMQDMLCSINDTPAGATIKISTYKLDDAEISSALKNAHKRGVNIQLFADASRGSSGASRSIETELNSNTEDESLATFCDGSCLNPGDGVQHAKVMTFSHTGVVVVGSTNLSVDNLRHASGTDYVIKDNPQAFAAANTYIDSLGDSTDRIGQPSALTDSLSLTFAPYKDPQTEPLLTVLQSVDCHSSNGTITNIDAAEYDMTWGRKAVIERVGELARAGCRTSIVINGKNDKYTHEREEIAQYLRKNGAHVIYPVAKGRMVHDKSLAIKGVIGGKDSVATIISSANVTKNAITSNTEVTATSNSATDYETTVRHLREVFTYAAGTTN